MLFGPRLAPSLISGIYTFSTQIFYLSPASLCMVEVQGGCRL